MLKNKKYFLLIFTFVLMLLGFGTTNIFAAQVSGLTSEEIYTLTNVSSGKCLNVNYGTDANGTNVTQYTNDGSIEQRFKLVYNSRDSYNLYTMCSSNGNNRVIDVLRTGGSSSGSLVAGCNVDIWAQNDNDAQDFIIYNEGNGNYSLRLRVNTNLALATYGSGNGSGSGTSSNSNGNAVIQTYSGDSNQLWKIKPMAILYYSNYSPEGYTLPYITSMGYNAKELRGYGNQQFLKDLQSTKVLLFTGHGDSGVLTFDDNSHIYGSYSSSTSNSISSLSNGSIRDKIFITYSCYGGITHSARGNIVNQANAKGATVAIGFTDEVFMGPAEVWSAHVFNYLSQGSSLYNAMNSADQVIMNLSGSQSNIGSSYRYIQGSTNIYL